MSKYSDFVRGAGGTAPVGTVARNKLNPRLDKWVPTNGGALNQNAYSVLYANVGGQFNNGTEPEGYFRLPAIPPYYRGDVVIQPMIKVEE